MTSSSNYNQYSTSFTAWQVCVCDSADVKLKAILQSPARAKSTTYTCRSNRLDSSRVSGLESENVLWLHVRANRKATGVT